MRLYDNTRLSDYKRCPKFYYYRHVRHWAPERKSMPLIFGGAWHAAMDVVWPGLIAKMPEQALVEEGWRAFLRYWTAEGMPPELSLEQEQEYSPRTPGNAYEKLVGYVAARKRIAGDYEILHIERPFAVPLDPDDDSLFYVGKIDKIVQLTHTDRVRGIEHKTTTAYSKASKFRSSFTDSFSPNSQVDGYLYALHLMYPGKVAGVWVDAALVHKTDEGFMFIPVERQIDHLDSWLFDVHRWIAAIEADKVALGAVQPTDKYMAAFPKNTNSCWDFSVSCPYLDLCKAWPNPVGKPTPPEYVDTVWDPLKEIPNLAGIIGGGT